MLARPAPSAAAPAPAPAAGPGAVSGPPLLVRCGVAAVSDDAAAASTGPDCRCMRAEDAAASLIALIHASRSSLVRT